ncbi:MAG: LrgB family protein [Pseudomonadota bacterium]
MSEFTEIWAYLSEGPLVWLTATLAAFLAADGLSARLGRHPLAHPVLLSVLILAAVLFATGTPYATYFEGAQFVHFMLGPATVALALPILDERARARRAALPIAAALLVGSAVAAGAALAVAWAFGAGPEALTALAPKSATAPVAMGIAERMGGSPTLAAVLVILTGVLGAIFGPWLLGAARVRSAAARGFALGVAAHGIGAARAFQEGRRTGAFAGLGMGLNAILTALIAPALLSLFL